MPSPTPPASSWTPSTVQVRKVEGVQDDAGGVGWGMNINKADAFANAAGVILDTFHFADLHHTLELNPSETERFRRSPADVVHGAAPMEPLLKSRVSASRARAPKVAVETRINFDDSSSATSTLLEIVTQDHPGPLQEIGASLAALGCNIEAAQEPAALPSADQRYKVDLILVVAHPDDEGAATAYLARALDEHKRVAVVISTRGSSGANKAGTEQAAALGDIREIEARNALATLGITNVWFLDGKDTASQNVLQSLANWGHGVALEKLVRLIRLTRPEVILTFLPGTFICEDHSYHQACGVLATEEFDLAGDPTTFPEQVAGPANRRELFLENLRPWQPKKIYYFPDADREDLLRGKGPSYSVKEISKSTKQPYWRISFDSFRAHQTQAKEFLDSVAQMDEAQIEKMAASDGWTDDMRFVLGKSLVGGSVTGDVFDGITPGAIPFARPEVSPELARPELSVELGGPYSFYAEFRRAHGLTNLPHAEPPEIALQAPGTMMILLWA